MRLELNILRQKHIPLHIAVNLDKLEENDVIIANELFEFMTKTGFPILTLNIQLNDDNMEQGKKLLQTIMDSAIFEEQVRVFIIGDWYNLDHKLVERAKFLLDNTKNFDKHFLNILVNYDGKEEVYSAIKLISKKLELKQIKEEEINDSLVKDNIFNSYFLPPELIIETQPKYSGLLLWDSKGSKIFFTKKMKTMMKDAIAFFQS